VTLVVPLAVPGEGSACANRPPPPTSPRRFALRPTKAGRLLPARRLSHSGSVPFTCHYGRHPRDTPGRSGPRNSQKTKHIPMRSSSSQADSAGSIPVTRSMLEYRCSRTVFENSRSLPDHVSVLARATLGHTYPHLGTHPSASEDAQLVPSCSPAVCSPVLPTSPKGCPRHNYEPDVKERDQ